MSDHSPYLTIEAILDDTKFKTGIKSIIAESEKTAEKSSNALSKIKDGFKNVKKYATYGVASFGLVTAAVGKLVNEYEEGEIAERRLAAVMKSMGTYTAQAHAEFIAFAKEMHATTNFTDDQVNKTVATLSTFSNLSKDVIKQAAKVSLDMGELLGGDAAIQIGKALQDKELAVGLRRVGVNIDMNKVKMMNMQEYQQYVLKELNTEFGGIAEASINPVKMLRKQIEDIMADMGKALLPLFKVLTPIVKGLMSVFSSVTSFLADLVFGSTDVLTAMKELRVANEQYKKSVEETTETDKLIAKYEELSKKANRTALEQSELEKITQKLASTMPQAVSAFDSLGNAMGINTQQAKALNKQLKDVANTEMLAQIDKASGEMEKAFKNWDKMKNIQAGKKGIADLGLFSVIGFDRQSLQNTSAGIQDQGEIAKQYKLSQMKLAELEGQMLSFTGVQDKYIERLARMKLGQDATTESIDNFRRRFRAMQDSFGELSNLTPLFEKLNNVNRKILAQEFYNQRAEMQAHGVDMRKWADERARVLLQTQNQRQHTFSQSAGKVEDIIGKLHTLRDELEWIKSTEIEIKIKDNIKKVLDQFEKLTNQDKHAILKEYMLFGSTAGDSLMSQRLKMRGYNEAAIFHGQAAMRSTEAQNAQELKKGIEALSQTYRDFIHANNELAKQFSSLDQERKKQLENLTQWETNYKRQALEGLSGYERELKEKQISQEFANRRKMINQLSDIQKAEAVTNTIGTVTNQVTALAQSKTIGQGITNAGNLAGNIPVVGGVIKGVTGIVGGLVDFFKKEGETFAEKWQRLFDLTQARYNFELAKENEIMASVQKRMEVYSRLEKLYYNNESKALEEQMKILRKNLAEIVDKFSQKGTLTLGGQTYDVSNLSEMSQEDQQALLEALTANESQYSNLAKTTVEYNMQQLRNQLASMGSIAFEGMSDSFLMGILQKNPQGQATLNAYNQWVKSLRDTGYTGGVYSIRDLLDRHGNDGGQGVSDLNRNMQEFMAYFNNAQASAESMSGYLETYIDQTAELVSLEEAKTNELSEQLNIQNKLNDTLKARLRALNDSRINSLLDKLADIEYQIATGQLTQSQGNIAMAQIESQIANQLSATGNTALSQQLLAARADLLKASNEKQYNALAGKGNIVEFHTGGFVTSDGIARLAAGEYVLRPDQYKTLADFVRGFPSATKTSENLIMEIINHFNITVKDDMDLNKIENAVYTVFKNIENQTGRRILSK